ncbi:MAG: 4Fe-4S binding protein [Colwellia sp.]
MSLIITEQCISCNACKLVCPKHAILITDQKFSIVSHRCDECKTDHQHPQCASICPVENAITNEAGVALNPCNSLSPSPAVLEFVLAQ